MNYFEDLKLQDVSDESRKIVVQGLAQFLHSLFLLNVMNEVHKGNKRLYISAEANGALRLVEEVYILDAIDILVSRPEFSGIGIYYSKEGASLSYLRNEGPHINSGRVCFTWDKDREARK